MVVIRDVVIGLVFIIHGLSVKTICACASPFNNCVERTLKEIFYACSMGFETQLKRCEQPVVYCVYRGDEINV